MSAPGSPVYPSPNAAEYWAAVTPSDSSANNFTQIPRALYVGGAGDVVAVGVDGATATFSSVPAGTILPIRPIRVNSTSTTATLLVALW